MFNFFNKVKDFLTSTSDYVGDEECLNVCNRCPKCKSYHIQGTLIEKTLSSEQTYEAGSFIEHVDEYWIKCNFKCLDCGYEWQDSGSYEERWTEEKEESFNDDNNVEENNEDEDAEGEEAEDESDEEL